MWEKPEAKILLIPEMFIESKDSLSPILCKLFNFMYNNSVYPSNWSMGVIVPDPKREIIWMLTITDG